VSTGTPITRELATKIIAHLRDRLGLYALGPDPADNAPLAVMPVGSYRRGLPMVGDIELIAPMPGPDDGDPLYERLAAHFYDPDVKPETIRTTQLALFGGAPVEEVARLVSPVRRERFGNPGKGFRPGFRYAQVELFLKGGPALSIKLDWFRFDAGNTGNRGWIQLIRTGPWDFGRDCCARWKRISNGGYSTSSEELGGCLHRSDGTRVPVPTETEAFRLLELPYIEPRERRGGGVA
jgi:hypothetical protein